MNTTDLLNQLNYLLVTISNQQISVVDENGNDTDLSISFFSLEEDSNRIIAWCQNTNEL